mgnify:CR=1 FL=1
MKLFRSRAETALDGIIRALRQSLENNAKEKLHERSVELHDSGKLSDGAFADYERIYTTYTEQMKNYNHRTFYHS